jgi:peptide/nickel transport system substrate-binding protein
VEAEADAEAPMLAELVQAGTLPPLAERLPESPCVCPMMEMTGKYGGIIRRGFKGVSDRWGPTKVKSECLAWFNADLSVRPNIAESWAMNEEASEWTWTLRKGTKWSDGHPFTSEDFQWWYEHQILNETLTPSPPYTGPPVVHAS